MPQKTRYLAIGRTYTADGWGPERPLFSVFVPAGDEGHAIDYARRQATRGPDGLAMHGAEHVTSVTPVWNIGRRPRNAKAINLPVCLPPAPDWSRWEIVEIKWENVVLQRQARVGEVSPVQICLSWAELRAAAVGYPWYRDVLRQCEAASY